VEGAGQVLLTLINDILDLSKLEAGKVELDVAPFDPRMLVEEVAGLVSESARGKGLELIAYCHPAVPVSLVGDFGRIRQVLLNLASNAVKFTAAGEVAISVDFLASDGEQPQARFEVRDTGIGIDEPDHERLFDPFSQADASTTRRYGGTGLGLAISRRLTHMMGGEIGVTSRLGEGSTFWFVLPMRASNRPVGANSDTGTTAIVTPDSSYAPLAGQRVLVVDDNATNRLVLESQLTSWNLIPESVADGASALELARAAAAAGRSFDIAVLDMCMPGMDGLQLARAISADENLRSIALIMLTSTPELDRAELAAAGIRQWLMKPVRSSEFFDRLVLLGAGSPPAQTPSATARVVQRNLAFPSRGLVLVVEDNEVNQLVAREMVTSLGYRAELATDGAEAVAAVRSTSYHAVLMDCHMPVMDGFEATAIIRGLAGNASRVPIIAMTAGAQDEDRQRCLDAGMDDFLAKPVDMSALKHTLARWMPDDVFPQFDTTGRRLDPGWPVIEPDQPSLEPSLDPARLELLRGLGPMDGTGVLADAARAFRSEIPTSLAALDLAITQRDDGALKSAAHKLKGGAANIGAAGAAALCAQLEKLPPADLEGRNRELIARLETELAKVDAALDRALKASS
jgi:CheY-like chemotaxis protein/HPt (histidine-containing phosphotransfer) domain-containing protein